MNSPSPPAGPPGSPPQPRGRPMVAVTVDVVVFTIVRDVLQILLVERGEEPFRGRWALPGGFVLPDEDLPEAALRELAEETGLSGMSFPAGVHLEQLGAYGAPDRDPRMRVVTAAYWAICADLPAPRGGGDAADARLIPVSAIEEGEVRLAFDHGQIVRDAVERIRVRLDQPDLAAKFCPPQFTLSQLRRVYEAVWSRKMDPGNFQRRIRRSGVLSRLVDATTPSGARGGRPASVWFAAPEPNLGEMAPAASGAGPDSARALPDAAAGADPGAAPDPVRNAPPPPSTGSGETRRRSRKTQPGPKS